MNFSANLLRYTEQVRHGAETAGWATSSIHGQDSGVVGVYEMIVDLAADLEWQAQESRVFCTSQCVKMDEKNCDEPCVGVLAILAETHLIITPASMTRELVSGDGKIESEMEGTKDGRRR